MPKRTTPDLSLPLSQPIILTRGPRWHLVTLMDAAILIRDLEPFRRARPVWDRAAEMILLAGATRKVADVQEATRQLLVAVERENGGSQMGEPQMSLETVQKKIRESHSFLDEMRKQERRAFGDKNYDSYLSAFLSAARSIDYRLRHEYPATYPAWRTKWDAGLSAEENCLIRFMIDDRNVEVHGSGSGRGMKTEEIKVGNSYSDESGILTVFHAGVPGSGMGGPATIYKPSYYFTIAGTERNATAACADYLALLERMVSEFEAAQS